MCFENFKMMFHRLQIWSGHISNKDERGLTTVPKPDMVAARFVF